MGCSESKSEQELLLNELWDSSTICQSTPEEYIERFESLIEKFKEEINQKEKP